MPFLSPEPLAAHHDLESFHSGVFSLDEWLKRRARANHQSGAFRTFVLCDERTVAGYYALAAGSITGDQVPSKFRRNLPDPIPVAVLARLAVHSDYQARGLGRALFVDAARRFAQAADSIGIRGIIVHAISADARGFYVALGFDPCPELDMTLLVTLSDLREALR